MTQEETMLAKRLEDLSRRADQRGIATYSDFLNLNEQNIFHTTIPKLYSGFQMFGGYECAERQMIAFLPDALFPVDFPLVCLKIAPLNRRFADLLNHRDVLGSLMSLGIERAKLGDILIEETQIYLFCHTMVCDYLSEALTRIRHTSVTAVRMQGEIPKLRPHTQPCSGIVSSNRLDALIAQMCGISRSQSGDLIKRGSVFINGRMAQSASVSCKPGEILSVRGTGRFRFLQTSGETKKGRMKIQYEKYL